MHGRVSVDIGGTFTDIVFEAPDGRLYVSKISSTPHDPAEAVIAGVQQLLARLDMPPEAVREIVHGTTVGSNTLLQRSGARTGVLTTRGFRDVLEIGRIRTPQMFDLSWEKPEPLSPRRHRLEVGERIAADGTVVVPLADDDVREAARALQAEGIETLAICFVNSYANPAHELRAKEIILQEFAPLEVSVSCEILPEIKEYERTSTTVVNAYLLPAMRGYLGRLRSGLKSAGFRAPLLVVSSTGGMIGARHAAERPVFAVGSGPAGGVAGAAKLARSSAQPDLIVFDMGGTTAKASTVENFEATLTTEYEFRDGISSPSRFIKGGGYMLKVPAIDIAEVGAGGGSIAWIDEGGMLRVGPLSAGADPGPACYGLGNDKPTVTDANLILGYLNPASLSHGSLTIDPALAKAAIGRWIAEPLGLDLAEAAHGIRQIANANMSRAVRSVTVERGRDPRDMAFMAFGGSGPVHAAAIAADLGIETVIIPTLSGVFCSVGMLASDIEHKFVRTVMARLDSARGEEIDAVAAALKEEGRTTLASEGYDDAVALRLEADLRYFGQSSELTVAYPDGPFTDRTRATLYKDFQDAYTATFGFCNDEPLEFVNLRLTAAARREDTLDFDNTGARIVHVDPPPGRRPVAFARGQGYCDTEVLPRQSVTDKWHEGPLVVEAYDTTIAVPPGARVRSDQAGSLILEIAHE